MEQNDILTLEAFLVALSEQENPLDATIQTRLRDIGDRLETDTRGAIESLRKLIRDFEFLQVPYKQARSQLQSMYRVKPRNKCIVQPGKIQVSDDDEYRELKNALHSLDSVKITRELFCSDSVKKANSIKQEKQGLDKQQPSPPPPSNSTSPPTDLDSPHIRWFWIRGLYGE